MSLYSIITGNVKPHTNGIHKINGDFNPGYICRFRHFMSSTGFSDREDVTPFLPNGKKSGWTKLRDAMNTSKTRGEVLLRVKAELCKIIAGLETTDTGLQDHNTEIAITDAVMDCNMIAFKLTLDVNMDNIREGKDNPLAPHAKPYRQALKDDCEIEVPDTISQDFYFIAPKNRIKAIIQAVHTMASQEAANERFFSKHPTKIHEVVAYMNADEETKEKFRPAPLESTWFDMDINFFLSLDEEVFKRLSIAFNAKDASEDLELTGTINQVVNDLSSVSDNAKGGVQKRSAPRP